MNNYSPLQVSLPNQLFGFKPLSPLERAEEVGQLRQRNMQLDQYDEAQALQDQLQQTLGPLVQAGAPTETILGEAQKLAAGIGDLDSVLKIEESKKRLSDQARLEENERFDRIMNLGRLATVLDDPSQVNAIAEQYGVGDFDYSKIRKPEREGRASNMVPLRNPETNEQIIVENGSLEEAQALLAGFEQVGKENPFSSLMRSGSKKEPEEPGFFGKLLFGDKAPEESSGAPQVDKTEQKAPKINTSKVYDTKPQNIPPGYKLQSKGKGSNVKYRLVPIGKN